MVKTGNECLLGNYMSTHSNLPTKVCCARTLFKAKFLFRLVLNTLPAEPETYNALVVMVCSGERSTRSTQRIMERDTAQTERTLTRLVITSRRDSRSVSSNEKRNTIAQHPCIASVPSCVVEPRVTHTLSVVPEPTLRAITPFFSFLNHTFFFVLNHTFFSSSITPFISSSITPFFSSSITPFFFFLNHTFFFLPQSHLFFVLFLNHTFFFFLNHTFFFLPQSHLFFSSSITPFFFSSITPLFIPRSHLIVLPQSHLFSSITLFFSSITLFFSSITPFFSSH